MPLLDDVTRALRTESSESLASTLRRLLDRQPTPLPDYRDLLVALAPVYDCATRLGLDRVSFFDKAAQDRSDEIVEVLQKFARRDDVTPEVFDFLVEDTPDGPKYRWASR